MRKPKAKMGIYIIYIFIRKGQVFKILTIGVLIYLFYRLVLGPSELDSPNQQELENDSEDDFVEYEEIE